MPSPANSFSRHPWFWAISLAGLFGVAVAAAAFEGRTWTLVGHTCLLAAATTALAVPLATLLALLLVRSDLPGRHVALLALGLMPWVPLYLQAAAWQAGFGLQGWLPIACGGPVLLGGWCGAIWIHAVAAIPWAVGIIGAGLWLVRPELEEIALLDGSAVQVVLRVTLRSALPAIAAAALWIAVTTAGEMTVTDLFGVRTYAEEIYTRAALGEELSTASLTLLPGLALTAWCVLSGLLVCAWLSPAQWPLGLARRHVFRLRRWRWPALLLVALTVALLAGVPLGNLVYKAGVTVRQLHDERIRSWSAGKFLQMVLLAPGRNLREAGWSLTIGGLAATAAVAAGIVLGSVARRGRAAATAVLAVVAVCLAVPGPMLGVSIIGLLNRAGHPWLLWLYDHSILAPLLAQWVRCLPLATLILWHGRQSLPQQLLDNAAVDGAGPLKRLVWVTLPILWPSLAIAWLTALATALGELAASILVVPPGVNTLAIHIFGLLHYGVEDQVAGICLAMIAFFLAVAAAALWLGWKAGRIWNSEFARRNSEC
jgi:iron(III) transport system permease protein